MRRSTRFAALTGVAVALTLVLCSQGPVAARQAPAAGEAVPPLQPTIHPSVPENVDDYWFVPRPSAIAAVGNTPLADAALAYASGNYTAALNSARQAVAAGGPLEPYAHLYVALSELRQSHAQEA